MFYVLRARFDSPRCLAHGPDLVPELWTIRLLLQELFCGTHIRSGEVRLLYAAVLVSLRPQKIQSHLSGAKLLLLSKLNNK